MTVKDVIAKYQRGEIGYAVPDQEPQLAFDFVTENDITDVRETLRGNHAQSSTDLQRRLASRGTHVSKPTVQKAIKATGFTASKPRYGQMIRQPNKEKRVEFCQKHILDNNFDNIIWTDECTIQLHDNKVVIYRPIDGMTHTIPKPKHPLKIHVWAGISRRGPTQITHFDGILRKEFFVDNIIKGNLLPFIQTTFPDSHRFQQDNDPKHKSKLAQEFMTRNSINWWKEWPSESCDLNPIEMVWNQLKRYLAKKEPTTKDALVQHTMNFWYTEMSVETCNRYIDHNFKVVPVIVLMGGRATGDVPKKLFKESSEGKSIRYFNNILQTEQMQRTTKMLFPDENQAISF